MSLLDTLQYSKLSPAVMGAIQEEQAYRQNNQDQLYQGLSNSMSTYIANQKKKDQEQDIKNATDKNGNFDRDKYLQNLSQSNPEEFKKQTEAYQTQDLNMQKMQSEINKNKSAAYKDTLTAAKTELDTNTATIDRFIGMLGNTNNQEQFSAVIENAKTAGVYDDLPPQFKNQPFSSDLKNQLNDYLVGAKDKMTNDFNQAKFSWEQYNDNLNRQQDNAKFDYQKKQDQIQNDRNATNDEVDNTVKVKNLSLAFKNSAENSIKNKMEIDKMQAEKDKGGKIDQQNLIKYSDQNAQKMNELKKEMVETKREFTTMQAGNRQSLELFQNFRKSLEVFQARHNIPDNEGIGWIERFKKEAMPASEVAKLERSFQQVSSAAFMVEKEGMRGFGALSDKDVDQIKAAFAPTNIQQQFSEFYRNIDSFIKKIQEKISNNEVNYRNSLAVNAETQDRYKQNQAKMDQLLGNNNNSNPDVLVRPQGAPAALPDNGSQGGVIPDVSAGGLTNNQNSNTLMGGMMGN